MVSCIYFLKEVMGLRSMKSSLFSYFKIMIILGIYNKILFSRENSIGKPYLRVPMTHKKTDFNEGSTDQLF